MIVREPLVIEGVDPKYEVVRTVAIARREIRGFRNDVFVVAFLCVADAAKGRRPIAEGGPAARAVDEQRAVDKIGGLGA